MTKEQILIDYPEIKKHHVYCVESFVEAKIDRRDWVCICDILYKYDDYIGSPINRQYC